MSRPEQSSPFETAHTLEAPSHDRALFNMRQELDARGVSGTDIDNIGYIDYRRSGGEHAPTREHLLLAVNRGFLRDVIWFSPPPVQPEEEGILPLTIVTKPGLCEIIEDGIGWQFHKEMANRNPFATVVTHATEGFGPSARHCSIMELSKQGLDSMAEHGRELLSTYFHDERLAIVATSMGTVITHKLARDDRQGASSDQLNIVANIHYAPAQVVPEKVVTDMLVKFPVSMLYDGAAELITRTSPRRFFELFGFLVKSRPGLHDIPPIIRQIIDLSKGTSEEEIRENANYYNTAVIVGERDPVGQPGMWREMPVRLYEIKKRGHGIATKPREGAIKATSTLHELGVYYETEPPSGVSKKAA